MLLQADLSNGKIRHLWANGTLTTLYIGLSGPASISSDGAGGFVIADNVLHQVRRISSSNAMTIVSAWGASARAI